MFDKLNTGLKVCRRQEMTLDARFQDLEKSIADGDE